MVLALALVLVLVDKCLFFETNLNAVLFGLEWCGIFGTGGCSRRHAGKM